MEFVVVAGQAQFLRCDASEDDIVLKRFLIFLEPLEGGVFVELRFERLIEFGLVELEQVAGQNDPWVDPERGRCLNSLRLP